MRILPQPQHAVRAFVFYALFLTTALYGWLWPQPVNAQFAQPYLVEDINTRTLRSDPYGFTPAKGILYFAAADGIHGSELWRSDGSAAGTWLVKDLLPGWEGSFPEQLQVDDQGTLYFLTRFPNSNVRELWRSDGTAQGTVAIIQGQITWLAVLGNAALFSQENAEVGQELWKTDGTPAGTRLVKDINPGPASSYVNCSLRTQTILYCYADDGTHGGELWRTDGTAQGTYLVKDINPANTVDQDRAARLDRVYRHRRPAPQQSESPTAIEQRTILGYQQAALLDDLLYFTAYTPTTGTELWQSDGTANGTRLVKEIVPGSGSVVLDAMRAAEQLLYFTIRLESGLTEVWRSDGTATGTQRVANGNTHEAATLGDTLFFVGGDESTGLELWRSDGTVAGTALVADSAPGPASSAPGDMVVLKNKLYFFATDARHGRELWVYDPTAGSPQLLKDLLPGPASPTPLYGVTGHETVVIDERIYFRAIDPEAGYELWQSDGSANGTAVVKDIHQQHNESAQPTLLTPVGEHLYFFAKDGGETRSLWKSNATATAAEVVVGPLPTDQPPLNMVVLSDTLYFAVVEESGPVLMQITAQETQRIAIPLPAEKAFERCCHLVAAGGQLFFTVLYTIRDQAGTITAQETALWVTDGSRAGTRTVKVFSSPSSFLQGMVAFQEQLYFVAAAQADDQQLALWRTDGQMVVEVKVLPFDNSISLHFAVMGEQLFFNALTAEQGATALWRSDGTTAGTVLVAPLQLAPCRENQRFVTDQTHLFFCAADAEHGAELWKSDGTGNGTMRVKDLVPGPQGSYPTPLLSFADRLYLQTADGATPSALWQSDGTANGTQLFAEQFVTDRHTGAAITQWRNQLYFMAGASTDATKAALWRSDGTIPGTALAAHLPHRAASSHLLITTPAMLFFIGYTPATSEELWALDTTLDQQIFLPLLKQ